MDPLYRLLMIIIIVIIILMFIVYIYNIYINVYINNNNIIKKKNNDTDYSQNNNNNNINNNNNNNEYNYELLSSMKDNLKYCTVPTLNTEQCYKSRHYECPIINGTYLQCTNNYIPKPKEYNADCGNRTFDMVPEPWKISENCYYNKIKFNREKTYDKVKFV